MRSLIEKKLKEKSFSHFESIRSFIIGPELLDIGAAEGWVGEAISTSLVDIKITLCDVIDLNRTELPHVVYNGTTLPFENKKFDTTLIMLTLHHCLNWEKVLEEALRVTKKRLIITESVYRFIPGKTLLWTMDTILNSFRSKKLMSEALHFKTENEWSKLFLLGGLEIAHQSSSITGLHRKALFVLNV